MVASLQKMIRTTLAVYPYDYDETPEKFRPIKPRPRWWVPFVSIFMIAIIAVPVFIAPPSATRNLYIMGFMLMVIIFALYRIIFSTVFGEKAAKREFRLPRTKRTLLKQPPRPAKKRERIRSADGAWLEVVDDDAIPPEVLAVGQKDGDIETQDRR
jgi:hypothetical protein